MPNVRCSQCGAIFEQNEPRSTDSCPDCGYTGEVSALVAEVDDLWDWIEDDDE